MMWSLVSNSHYLCDASYTRAERLQTCFHLAAVPISYHVYAGIEFSQNFQTWTCRASVLFAKVSSGEVGYSAHSKVSLLHLGS